MSPEEGEDWPVLPDEPGPDGPPSAEEQTVGELTRIAQDLEALRPAVPWLRVIAALLLVVAVILLGIGGEVLYRIMQQA
jgi:hypothetical protein